MRIIGIFVLVFGMLQGVEKVPSVEESPIAPSLPKLTEEQEARLDAIVDKFILFDTGRLPGQQGQKAKADFQALKLESVPALLRGLQKASKIDHSCPVALISQKLKSLLLTSNDSELLDFARDEISSAIEDSRHGPILRDLRARVTIARNKAIVENPPVPKWLREMPVIKMLDALKRNESPSLLQAMAKELARRTDKESLLALAEFAYCPYREINQPSGELLIKRLKQLNDYEILGFLVNPTPAVKLGALKYLQESSAMPKYADVIALLDDANSEVRQMARKTLMKWAPGKDFGPDEKADVEARRRSMKEWRVHFHLDSK